MMKKMPSGRRARICLRRSARGSQVTGSVLMSRLRLAGTVTTISRRGGGGWLAETEGG